MLFYISDVCIAQSSSILYLFLIVCEVNRFSENTLIRSFPATLLILAPFQKRVGYLYELRQVRI